MSFRSSFMNRREVQAIKGVLSFGTQCDVPHCRRCTDVIVHHHRLSTVSLQEVSIISAIVETTLLGTTFIRPEECTGIITCAQFTKIYSMSVGNEYLRLTIISRYVQGRQILLFNSTQLMFASTKQSNLILLGQSVEISNVTATRGCNIITCYLHKINVHN